MSTPSSSSSSSSCCSSSSSSSRFAAEQAEEMEALAALLPHPGEFQLLPCCCCCCLLQLLPFGQRPAADPLNKAKVQLKFSLPPDYCLQTIPKFFPTGSSLAVSQAAS
ncbi:hypothetical protein ENH_00017230 [Eimeria necatrix]|uniref:Uncharacterized protein n=1 Tax=Eimeria necatrix TaxID=51315 RepID=U6MM63_9EIME|nr:hypothetical protein ENH_00017230 [Eimeria necatrix]CDJ65342.1 hypothetical protein ENH_00017230 [Eimeria necatrix]